MATEQMPYDSTTFDPDIPFPDEEPELMVITVDCDGVWTLTIIRGDVNVNAPIKDSKLLSSFQKVKLDALIGRWVAS